MIVHSSCVKMAAITWSILLTYLNMIFVSSWHDPAGSDKDFHCWPMGTNVPPFPECPVSLIWREHPPDVVKQEERFNLTYELTLDTAFYEWAIQPNVGAFSHITSISSSESAQAWCEHTQCPSSKSAVSRTNCCIYHVNIHACPITDSVSFCGPWIPSNGTIYTHSPVLWGNAKMESWQSVVNGLFLTGWYQVIAHFKIGNIQVTKKYDIKVTPKTVCGDDVCDLAEGETCSTCPSDCGKCLLPMYSRVIVGLTIFLVILIIVIISVVLYRKNQALLWDNSWILAKEDIQQVETTRNMSSMSVRSANSNNSARLFQAGTRQRFIQTVLLNGQTYAVKTVPKRAFFLSKEVRTEIKKVRVLENSNLAKFTGACIDPDRFMILTEYCEKGSLNDVLLNDDVPINWAFRFSFASDVARGMHYLHMSGITHGRLKSQNCIIDDRWTVKVTDFGMRMLRERHSEMADEEDKIEEQVKQQKMLVYSAPETFTPGYLPAPEADVYSYAIILVEIASRNDPYGDAFVEDLPCGWKPPMPYLIDETSQDNTCPCPKEYARLIEECWSNAPESRPKFEHIRKIINKINPNRSSAIDLMMSMMEKYSKNLEKIVGERTADLMLEKQKTDTLLYSMLPRAVADKLRQGASIDAENYPNCTIYFSDIVGFTNLSGASSPMQVVALLNKLYTCFDSIIDNYQVYKVETIGDAYMVVSGVPEVNGDRHSYEIANMACDLVAECQNFVIPHMPKEPLKIRVGMHSGPVCAGVVGLKMPRYCLFGDTVNTASRMESNGEAYKIHVSNPTWEVLVGTKSFEFECRGTISVKGKGDMTTWWLTRRVKPYQASSVSIYSTVDEFNRDVHTLLGNDSDTRVKKISIASTVDSGYTEQDKLPPV